jgi:hypothetical protein
MSVPVCMGRYRFLPAVASADPVEPVAKIAKW